MKAMILAAGRGERMKPLTDHCPKPLLKVSGTPLIEHHLVKLAQAGIQDIVINYAWLGQQLVDYLGNGEKWQVKITYSNESEGALETAGGIIKALPMLGDEPFLVVNGDVYGDFDFTNLSVLQGKDLAHLYLVDNPKHNQAGDFALNQGRVINTETKGITKTLTYSGIGIYQQVFFTDFIKKHQQQVSNNKLALGPLLKAAANEGLLSGEKLDNQWTDVGTPERLQMLNSKYVL